MAIFCATKISFGSAPAPKLFSADRTKADPLLQFFFVLLCPVCSPLIHSIVSNDSVSGSVYFAKILIFTEQLVSIYVPISN